MPVEAVQQDRQYHALRTLGQGAAIGAATGYAAKYIQPLTADEKRSDEYVKVTDKIRDQKTEYSVRTRKYLDTMKAKNNKSLAEDEFIKLFDGMKDGDHVKRGNIRTAIKTLEEKNPLAVAEFKNLCKETSRIAEKTAQQCVSAYKLVTKHIRPTGFFLTTGAVVGASIALINDALKTKVNN